MEPEVPSDDGQSRGYSPLVRRLAEEFDVDLDAVKGTGPGGRVTRADVQQAAFGTTINPEESSDAPILPLDNESDSPESEGPRPPQDHGGDGPAGEPDDTEPKAEDDDEQDGDEPEPESAADDPTEADSEQNDGSEQDDDEVADAAVPAPEPEPEEVADRTPTRGPVSAVPPVVTPTIVDLTAEIPPVATGPSSTFTLFTDIDATALLNAWEALLDDRDETTPLAAFIVRILAPTIENWPTMNARRSSGFEPVYQVDLAVAGPLSYDLIPDAGNRSLNELTHDLAHLEVGLESPVDDVGGPKVEPSFVIDYLVDTVVDRAAPQSRTEVAASLALGRIRPGLGLVDDEPRAVPTITVGLTCLDAIGSLVASGFLADVTRHLEDPILVFAD